MIRAVPVMGHAGRGWSTHCEVRYTDVRVPRANVLGEPGDGFRIAQKRLGPGRSTTSCAGSARCSAPSS